MQKNNNKNIKKVDKYTAKMRIIGGVICLVALITAFLVGLFVGKSIVNKKEDIQCSNDIVLTADTDYVLNGTYIFNETLNLNLVYSSNPEFIEAVNFECDIFQNGNLSNLTKFGFDLYDGVKYFFYLDADNNRWPCYNTDNNRWNGQNYRTVYITNQTVSSSFYYWFIANATVSVPPVTTYNITYNFNNVISNGVDLPSTVDSDETYTLLFNTNGVDGYFPLSQYLDVTVTNCNYNFGYGNYGSLTDSGFIANLAITISDIVGDVNISFNGTSILQNSTVIYLTGDIDVIGVQFYNLVNCDVYYNNNNIVIYPFDVNSNYEFTVDIFSDIDTISIPVVNIVNGSSFIIYDYFNKTVGDVNDDFTCNFLVRANSVNSAIQIKIRLLDTEFEYISTSFVDWLVTAVGGFFDFSIMPGLSLGLILGSIIIIAFVCWVLRVFMGG